MWDSCAETHLNKLNSLHRRAAKLLLPDKNSSTDEKMKVLSILPLQKQLYFNKAVLMFKMNRRITPSYIVSLFTESNNRTNRYVLPKPRIDLFKTSLSFSGSTCWNSLPVAIKTVGTIKSFESVLHEYLMWEQFSLQLSNVLNLQLLDPPGYDDCLLSIWFKRRCCHLSPLRAYALSRCRECSNLFQ